MIIHKQEITYLLLIILQEVVPLLTNKKSHYSLILFNNHDNLADILGVQKSSVECVDEIKNSHEHVIIYPHCK